MKFLESISQNGENSIFFNQNDQFLLQCQVAQRSEYSCAKKIMSKKTIVMCGFAILSILASIIDVDWISALVSLLAVVLLIANKYVQLYIVTHKKHSALIQQYIDATLYSHIIGGEKSEWGNMPNYTDLAKSISEFTNADISEVRNWYSDYSSLSPYKQIFHCQRENVRWDYELQKKFKLLQIALVTIVLLITLTVFFVFNPTFIKSICVLSWFAPIAEYFYSIYKEVDKDIKLLQNIDEQCNTIESKLTSESCSGIKKLLIDLQYKILDRRETGVLIPDQFYRFHLKKLQENEDKIARNITDLNRMNGEE